MGANVYFTLDTTSSTRAHAQWESRYAGRKKYEYRLHHKDGVWELIRPTEKYSQVGKAHDVTKNKATKIRVDFTKEAVKDPNNGNFFWSIVDSLRTACLGSNKKPAASKKRKKSRRCTGNETLPLPSSSKKRRKRKG